MEGLEGGGNQSWLPLVFPTGRVFTSGGGGERGQVAAAVPPEQLVSDGAGGGSLSLSTLWPAGIPGFLRVPPTPSHSAIPACFLPCTPAAGAGLEEGNSERLPLPSTREEAGGGPEGAG